MTIPAHFTNPHGPACLAVTGAKGGVGKSNLVLNLAVALGRWGRRVLLVDGDLGLANVDVLLGLNARYTVEHLVEDKATLDQVLLDGPRNVRVLPAASGLPNLSGLDDASRERLLTLLAQNAGTFDQMLVDTGAGLGDTSLALQLAASRVVLVTTPEPTSLVDAYASLKVLWTTQPEKRVDIVINAARDEQEAVATYRQFANAAERFLGRKPGSLGPVFADPHVADAVRRQRALLELHPTSPAARCYERIAFDLAFSETPGSGTNYWSELCAPKPTEALH